MAIIPTKEALLDAYATDRIKYKCDPISFAQAARERGVEISHFLEQALVKFERGLNKPMLQTSHYADVEVLPSKPTIEPVDTAKEIANKHSTSIALVSKSRSGKTTVSKALLYYLAQKDPRTQFIIADGKSERWMGLEDVGVVEYLDPLNPKIASRQLAKQVLAAKGIMNQRQSLDQKRQASEKDWHPVYLFVSDWFTVLATLKAESARFPEVKDDLVEVITALKGIAATGAAYKVWELIDTQSPKPEDFGFTSTDRQNLHFFALGNQIAGWKSLTHTLTFYTNGTDRDRLTAQLKAIQQLPPPTYTIYNSLGNESVDLLVDYRWVEEVRLVEKPKTENPLGVDPKVQDPAVHSPVYTDEEGDRLEPESQSGKGTRAITGRYTAEQAEWLSSYCCTQGKSQTEILRLALNLFIEAVNVIGGTSQND